MLFGRIFPDVSSLTKIIPYFLQHESCEGACNPDAEGVYRGWKSSKKGFKYKKTIVLAQDSHLTLVCPESSLENTVIWRKDGKTLKAGTQIKMSEKESEPTITVDTFNTLYLHGVTSAEKGNYTCQVDKVRMQQIRIFIVSKSRLLTQAFLRHMVYLAFVLSLTLSCYCAGLYLTWKRRHKFKKYHELKAKLKDDDEDEALTKKKKENIAQIKIINETTKDIFNSNMTESMTDLIDDSSRNDTFRESTKESTETETEESN